MCLNEIYSKVWVGIQLFPRLRRRCFISCACQVASEYAIEKVQLSQEGLKIKETYQILPHTDYVILMGEVTNTVKKHRNLIFFC